MSLSQESIKRLRAVKEAILANPKFYNQNTFGEYEDDSVCETTCCIAGWADYLFNGEKAHKEHVDEWLPFYKDETGTIPRPFSWYEIGAAALGVDTTVVKKSLFREVSLWPEQFSDLYYNNPSPEMKAAAAAARIEHFIATDGQE